MLRAMNSSDPLASAWAKMDWANKTVDRVEMAIQRIHAVSHQLQKSPVTVRGRVTDDGKEWIIYIHKVTRIPASLGLMAGDAVHNFRTVLDHIVWELAFIDGGGIAGGVEPKGNVQFPIIQRTSRNPTWLSCSRKFEVEAKRLLENVSMRHRAMIKRHQPYHSWPEDEPHPLSMLSDLDNDDKHRVLQPVFSAASEITTIHPKYGRDCQAIGEAVNENIIGRPLEVGTKVLTVPINVTGPHPYLDVKAAASLYIAFRNGMGVLETLKSISRKVRAIYTDFFPEFQRPKAKRVWRAREGRIQTPPPPKVALEESLLTSAEVQEYSEWLSVPPAKGE